MGQESDEAEAPAVPQTNQGTFEASQLRENRGEKRITMHNRQNTAAGIYSTESCQYIELWAKEFLKLKKIKDTETEFPHKSHLY